MPVLPHTPRHLRSRISAIADSDNFRLKLIIQIIEKDRRLRSYTDVIGYGLGPVWHKIVSSLFIFEVIIWVSGILISDLEH